MARSRSGRNHPVLTIIFGLIFAVVAAAGILSARAEKKMQERCTSSASAVVTSVSSERRSRKSGKHRTYYYVYVTSYVFEANDSEYSGKTTLSSGERREVGDTMGVYYNPAKPTEHFTENERVTAFSVVMPALFCVFGFIVVISALSVFRKARNNNMTVRDAMLGSAVAGSSNNFNNNYNNNFGSYNSANNYNSFNNGSSYNNNGSYSSSGFNNSYNNNGYVNTNSYNGGYSNNYNDNDYNQLN